MKKIIIVSIIAIGVYLISQQEFSPKENSSTETQSGKVSSSDQRLQQAFRNKQSDLQIEGSGVVSKILADDTKGSRHQRFILKLSTGQTILIAHNIDLAPRIDELRIGESVSFYGEYEWNAKGGVIHWTHHDPKGRHASGWLKHKGKVYQ